jgi:predicted dehydrogenase
MSHSHARALRGARHIELVALADVYEPNLRTAGAAYGVDRLYPSHRQLLEAERPDLLVVTTQAPQHAEIVIDAARAGVKGILCEKPIALTLAEADAMIAACDEADARLAIGHQTRMIPTTFAAERLIQEGAIGELRLARMLDKGGRPAGNSLMEMCTHIFDLLRIYAGEPAWVAGHLTVGDTTADGRRVPSSDQRLAGAHDIQYSEAAWTDRDCGLVLGDRCSATFGFGPRPGWHCGLTATLESFFQTRQEAAGETWGPNLELIGTDGILFLSGTSNKVDLFLHRGPWAPPGRLHRIEPAALSATETPAGASAFIPHQIAMLEELVAAIESGREHRSSGRDGRWALEMILGIYASHRQAGARVELPLADRGHPLQRWLADEHLPLPSKPAARVRPLRVPA